MAEQYADITAELQHQLGIQRIQAERHKWGDIRANMPQIKALRDLRSHVEAIGIEHHCDAHSAKRETAG